MIPNSPLLSIGITTFDRLELLKGAINSIISQPFADFEIIVGNDCINKQIIIKDLGFSDNRIRLFNHSENLGEMRNMNFLLEQSSGKYFTWLADDDEFHKHFLHKSIIFLEENKNIDCLYSNYWSGKTNLPIPIIDKKDINFDISIDKFDFLKKYLLRKKELIGCCGIYKQSFIKELGGMTQLGDGFSPFSDCLLAIKIIILGNICYTREPLIFFRMHEESVSTTSSDLNAYISAQKEASLVFSKISSENFSIRKKNWLQLYLHIWFLKDIYSVAFRLNNKLSTRNQESLKKYIFEFLLEKQTYEFRLYFYFFYIYLFTNHYLRYYVKLALYKKKH